MSHRLRLPTADRVQPASGRVRRAKRVLVLDIGTGATCIYPLLGARKYGWRFVGSEIDPVALRWANTLVAANPAVADLIECRLPGSPLACFNGVTKAGETFDLSMCNPPFHASAESAAEGARSEEEPHPGLDVHSHQMTANRCTLAQYEVPSCRIP